MSHFRGGNERPTALLGSFRVIKKRKMRKRERYQNSGSSYNIKRLANTKNGAFGDLNVFLQLKS